MKRLVLLILLISLTFSYGNGDNNRMNSKEEKTTSSSERKTSDVELKDLDFTVDTIFKNVTFESVEKIEFINIYNEDHQQIFSANANIIIGDTLNISFLEKGTYYLEVIIGENIGARQIIF